MLKCFSAAQFTSSVLLNSFYPLLSLPVSLSTWPQFSGKLPSIASLRLFLSFARCSCAALQANVCEQHMKRVCVCMTLWDVFAVMCVWVCGTCVCVCICCPQFQGNHQPLFFKSFFFVIPFCLFFTTCFCLAHQVYFVMSLRLMYVFKAYRRGGVRGG